MSEILLTTGIDPATRECTLTAVYKHAGVVTTLVARWSCHESRLAEEVPRALAVMRVIILPFLMSSKL